MLNRTIAVGSVVVLAVALLADFCSDCGAQTINSQYLAKKNASTAVDPNLSTVRALDKIDLGDSRLFVIDKLGHPRHHTPKCIDYSFPFANLKFVFDDQDRMLSEYVVRKLKGYKLPVLDKYGFDKAACLGCFSFRDASKKWEDFSPPPVIWFNMPAGGPVIYAEQWYMAGRAGESWKRDVILILSSEGLASYGDAWSQITNRFLMKWGGGGEQDFVKFYNKLSKDRQQKFIELRGMIRPNGYLLVAKSNTPTDDDGQEIGTASCSL